jgi:hypothetical protein
MGLCWLVVLPIPITCCFCFNLDLGIIAQWQLCWRWQKTFDWAWRMNSSRCCYSIFHRRLIWRYMDCWCASCEMPKNIRLVLLSVCWWGHISVNEYSLCDLLVKNLLLGLWRVKLLKDLFLACSCLYYIMTTSWGLSGITVFTYMRIICRFVTLVRRRTFKGVLNLDLQRVLNPMKSQVIVISCCRVDIPPHTLLIVSDVIKVVPKVNNLGFVLNERLTATDHFKK